MSLLLTASVKYVNVADRRGTIHALDNLKAAKQRGAKRRGEHNRKTYDAECGKRFVRLVVAVAVDGDGEPLGHVTTTWPPRVSALREMGLERCGECHELTGRRRPEWPERGDVLEWPERDGVTTDGGAA